MLFNIFMDFVVKQAVAQFGETAGIRISFCFEGKPLMADLSKLTDEEFLSILLYADDMVILAESQEELQRFLLILEAVTQRWGLTIHVKKTKLWHSAWPGGCVEAAQEVVLRGETVGEVEDFKYLGGTLATSGSLDSELHCRIARATGKFAQMRPIWRNKGISIKTKMLFYRAFIPPTLLYGCEAWAITPAQVNALNAQHMRFLRSILGISRWDRWRNERVAAKCGIPQVSDLISRARMGWLGHVARMGEDRLPHKILFGGLKDGKRGRGRPSQRLTDAYLGDIAIMSERGGRFHLNRGAENTWWEKAKNRQLWGGLIDAVWPRKPVYQLAGF
jgi:hypothetical protein